MIMGYGVVFYYVEINIIKMSDWGYHFMFCVFKYFNNQSYNKSFEIIYFTAYKYNSIVIDKVLIIGWD